MRFWNFYVFRAIQPSKGGLRSISCENSDRAAPKVREIMRSREQPATKVGSDKTFAVEHQALECELSLRMQDVIMLEENYNH